MEIIMKLKQMIAVTKFSCHALMWLQFCECKRPDLLPTQLYDTVVKVRFWIL